MTSAPAVAAEPTPAASATPSDPAGGPGRTSASPRPGARRRARPRLGLLLSAGFLVVVLLAALFPSLLAPGDPFAGASGATLEPPGPGHWFGTDHLGRDLYTRVVHGTGLTVATAAAAVAGALVVGGTLGLASGYVGGVADTLLMRVVDVLLSIPSLLLSLAVVAGLGFGPVQVAVAVGIGSVASFARIGRAQALRISQAPFVEAAPSFGTRRILVLLHHVVPNAVGPLVSLAVLEFGSALLAVSALSFLGYGVPRPAAEWGGLISDGRSYLAVAPWLTALPGLVIAATVLALQQVATSPAPADAPR